MVINNSPDISVFKVQVLFDLSVFPAVIRLHNLSTGAHLVNMDYIIEARSPNGAVFYQTTFSAPDIDGAVWTEYVVPATIPLFQGHIEFSTSVPYQVIVKAKDSAGTIFTHPPIKIFVPEPVGNEKATKNYAVGKLDIQVDCHGKEALIKDITAYLYGGHSGTLVSGSKITLYAPPDETGERPAAVVFPMFQSVAYPLNATGRGFNAVLLSIVDYEMAEDVTVRLRYIKSQDFDVNCGYDLMPILTEFHKLYQSNLKKCDDAKQRVIDKITPLITMAMMAKLMPMSNFDMGEILFQIKYIAGWNCDCLPTVGFNGNNPGGGSGNINPQFTVGGDIQASANVQGNNVMFTIKDYTYIFDLDETGYVDAFDISQTVNNTNRTKTFALKVNLTTLTEDILAHIGAEGNQALLDTFNTLIRSSFNFTVDGKCVINTNQACNYLLTLNQIPVAPNLAIFKTITIGTVEYPINLNFNRTTGIAALQTAINALGKGTFVVTIANDLLSIASTQNANVVTGAKVFGAGATADRSMDQSRSGCTGTVSYSPSTIVQAMIDYLCAINASQVRMGFSFKLATVKADGTLEEVDFVETDSVRKFIETLNGSNKFLISVLNNKTISYQAFLNLFGNTTSQIKSTDVLFGTRDGAGGRITQRELMLMITDYVIGTNDAADKAKWCQAISVCSTTATCNPVSFVSNSIRVMNMEDFSFSGNSLRYSGFYTNHNVPANIVITFVQVDAQGQLGQTATLTMTSGTNQLPGAIGDLPTIPAGSTWRITGITGQTTKKFLAVKIQNNGSGSYRVATRTYGSITPFSHTTYPAQAGQFTTLLFDVPENNYESSTIAVCGQNSFSQEVIVTNLTCPAPTAFNVTKSGSSFVATYTFPSDVTKFQLTVTAPNGGVSTYIANTSSAAYNVPQAASVIGDYKFQIRAVCNEANGYFGPWSQLITIANTASSGNTPPTVSAGPDVNITQPTSTATAAATITQGTGTIVQRAWTNTAKPQGSNPTIADATIEDAVFNALTVVGNYDFLLTVTDSLGEVGSDTMRVIVAAQSVPQFAITTQPQSQNVAGGTPFDLSVTVVNGVAPYTFIWKDVTAGGSGTQVATHPNINSTTDTLEDVTTTTTKIYRVDITDANGTPLSSATATITVALQFTIGYTSTNPYIDDTTPPASIPNSQVITVTPGSTFTATMPLAAQDTFVLAKYSATQPLRNGWLNGTAPGSGVISDTGGQEFRQIVMGGEIWIIARNEFSFDATQPLSFTPKP